MASSRSSSNNRQTRTRKMQRKKRMEELLKSAYSSDKDHLSDFPQFHHYNNISNGLSLFLESGRGDKLSSNLKQYIQKLLKINMEGPYGSEWPEEEKVKRREMSSPEALYIFVYKGPSTPSKADAPIIGFVQYRFTIEEETPVLYVYELQLEEAYQGKGVGKFLMQLVELIACKNCMGAVVLTVQKRNTSAINFYLNKLSYNISSISPSKVYQSMGVIGEDKSYEILCKTFDHEAKAVLEMDSKCIEIDPQDNESIQTVEVESVDKEVGGKRKRKEFNSDMALRSSRFNLNTFRDLILVATVRHELPFSFVEYKGIRDVITYLEPEANIISRNTVKADLFRMYKEEKENIRSMLMESPGMLCLTSDLWSSITTDGYLAITVHFIDKEWVLQKRVLSFSFMPPPHSDVALNAKVFSILEEWGLEKKIFCVTLDNASSNDRFVELLRGQLNTKSPLVSKGRFFHMRCCAHIVNLIVQDGLQEIDQVVCKVRESVKYVKGSHSQVRKEKFLDCVKLLSLNSKRGLRQDCPTRWNSTFLMLDSAIYYRKAFAHLEISDSNYTSCPSACEWDTIEKICVFLGVFYDVTNVFSGTKYPTANLYYPHIFMAYFTLHDSMSAKDVYMKDLATSMMEKFKKYWSDFSLTLAIAVVFDPRYKLHFIEWSYKKVYGEHNHQYGEVDELLKTTFDEYVVLSFGDGSSTNHASTSNSKVGEETSNDTRRLFGVRANLLDFDEFQSQESTANQKSELQLYLEEPRMKRTLELDVLAFWKSNEFRYPVLARMARDFLTIPISTVASESTFSASGKVLNKHRSSLDKETIEALICTKDWLFGGCIETDLDELAEDMMSMSLDVSPESDA